MSREVCLLADTIGFLPGGGHQWVFLNWAIGLRANGVRVHWLEPVPEQWNAEQLRARLAVLRSRLHPYGLDESVALVGWTPGMHDIAPPEGCAPFGEVASGTDLLLNFLYHFPSTAIARFRHAALVDIDPGLTQHWLSTGQICAARHSLYFTTGETVGRSAQIPDCGLPWIYTPPCVALDAWPVTAAPADASFTTVSGWYADEWVATADGHYSNDKRHGFLPFLELPRRTRQPLELALNLSEGEIADRERLHLESFGWRVRQSYEVAGTPADYQRYIQASRGEFSAVKPSCVRLQNAWISDRTLCYLASGKPAIVQHTGPSRFLPTDAGLFRFRTLEEAAAMLDLAATDYEYHSRLARALAEDHFDAAVVVRRVLERALT